MNIYIFYVSNQNMIDDVSSRTWWVIETLHTIIRDICEAMNWGIVYYVPVLIWKECVRGLIFSSIEACIGKVKTAVY